MKSEVQYIELLIELLTHPATSRNEQERSDFLEGYLKGLGFNVDRFINNLLVGNPDLTGMGPNILLNSHMDTVSPAEGWVTDPYVPKVVGEKIIGLGSNDAGASVVTLIATYQKMHSVMQGQMNLLLLINAEEEVSGANGISSVLERLGHLDAIIVGEPTQMKPAVAERGLMVLDGVVKGKAGHAARKEGENAIFGAMKDVESIAGLRFSEKSDWLPEPGAQVTMISAGTGHNVVPDVCRYVVDVRSNDRYENETMLDLIRSVCVADLKPRSTRLKPSSLDPDHFLMKAIEKCGLQPFGSSTLSDMALIPFPAIKMGPGDSARSHTAGEYILVSELEEGVKIYTQFLESLKDVLKIG